MNKKGFTLMELLAVVIIIGILSSVALPQYRKVVEKGQFTKAQVMAKSLHDSCQRLIAEWGVDTYSDLPSSVRNLSRLDIGSEELLPVGFTIYPANNVIIGAGFRYTLRGGESCFVHIEKIEGAYKGVSMNYDGTSFYRCADDGSGACDIYGVD